MNDLEQLLRIMAEAGTREGGPATQRVMATALSTMQPSNNAFLPGGVGYPQQLPYITPFLLPETSASPDGTLKATYWKFGREGLLNMSDEIGMYGEFKRADLGLTSEDITLVEHGMSAWISPLERNLANSIGVNIEDQKAAMIKTMVETRREALGATLLTTSGSYASASHYTTLTGTDQWSHSSSDPLKAIADKMEFGRTVIGAKYNVLWLSPTAAFALTTNKNIIQYVNGGATKSQPGYPITLEMIRAMLGLKAIYVGEAVAATTAGGTISDVWNDCAGLLYVGGAGMYDQKFGVTLVSSGYPVSRVESEPHKGGKGIDILYYTDAYKHAVQLNTAGFLWQDVTA